MKDFYLSSMNEALAITGVTGSVAITANTAATVNLGFQPSLVIEILESEKVGFLINGVTGKTYNTSVTLSRTSTGFTVEYGSSRTISYIALK